MFRPRIIPILLISNDELVKSVGFRGHRYIGDPVNAARIFSELKADELILLDIEATKNNAVIHPDLISNISSETNMPLSAGGGIKTLQDIDRLVNAGAEKVIIGSAAFENPEFIEKAAAEFGSSTISVCADVKRNGSAFEIWYKNASQLFTGNFLETCKLLEELGAGELIIQSVDNDGERSGYDNSLIELVSRELTIPLVALGGAGNLQHLTEANLHGASAMAAGSMFVYHKNGVLINYPEKDELNGLFSHR